MNMGMQLKSFAKINRGLTVHGRLENGYHLLSTVFQTISLHDTLEFQKASGLSLECSDPRVPQDETNLVLKSAIALRERFKTSAGARIILQKNIPSPGGLGGGSSNAAIALFGLARLWSIDVGFLELVELAKQVGADVPFFLYGGTAVGCGRGDEILPLTDFPGGNLLVLTPNFGISTAEAFEALHRPTLTSSQVESNLRVCRSARENLNRDGQAVNDFEKWAFGRHRELAEMAGSLVRFGATSVNLSGSGPSIFAIFEKEETRQATIEALSNSNWRMFAVATVTRSEYRAELAECEGLFPISF